MMIPPKFSKFKQYRTIAKHTALTIPVRVARRPQQQRHSLHKQRYSRHVPGGRRTGSAVLDGLVRLGTGLGVFEELLRLLLVIMMISIKKSERKTIRAPGDREEVFPIGVAEALQRL
ncbi:hypothetical protein CSQ92_27950 [Janthinobacterium sp. BJB446]|nr:hypothetical protein CSQ92_27950 [Janthinobacterium sp. BJB446]